MTSPPSKMCLWHRALYRSVEVEQEIPMELYKAVAEVLAYVYRVRKRL